MLTWKKNFFRLDSIGSLNVYDLNDRLPNSQEKPMEVYNLMGGRVQFEQNKIISFDDGRGNYLVVRCATQNQNHDDELFTKWKNAFESQVIDRSDDLWVRPNHPLNNNATCLNTIKKSTEKKVLIVDIGTCSIRSGLYNINPQLPQIFVPSVCSKDKNGKLKVGFDAFDSILGSCAPSTIDLTNLHKSYVGSTGSPLIFPFKAKNNIDKLNVNIESFEAVLDYVVENLNIKCDDYQVLIITSNKLNDKANIQLLNLLLENEKFRFQSATIINQALLTLYFYNTNVGIVVNMGEKIGKNFIQFKNFI